jgi:CBS domain-containing protein
LKNTPSNVVLIRENPSSQTALSTFDYNDLNAYLLVVVGLASPDEQHVALYDELVKKAQSQQPISLKEIQELCRKEELVVLPTDSTLDKAIEIFGSGIHRIVVTGHASEVVGILSQLRLVEFFWQEGVNFPAIERLYGVLLRDLGIGSHKIIAIK